MTILERLQFLRTHLLTYWEMADEWIGQGAPNGIPCLLLVSTYGCITNEDYARRLGTSRGYVIGRKDRPDLDDNAWNKIHALLGVPNLLDLLVREHREGVLLALDRAIAKAQEQDVDPNSPIIPSEPDHVPEPVLVS